MQESLKYNMHPCNSYIVPWIDLEIGENISKAKIPSQNPKINSNHLVLKSPRFRDPTHKSNEEKGLGTESYCRSLKLRTNTPKMPRC